MQGRSFPLHGLRREMCALRPSSAALAINWLKEANISAVSRLMRLSWHEVDGIMLRAVLRGLTRREVIAPKRMGVDETSFQKRHEYVTVVTDLDDRKVLHVSDNRKAESLAEFYRQLKPGDRRKIAVVAMDMHQPYISATEEFEVAVAAEP